MSGPHLDQQYSCSSTFQYPGQLLKNPDCPGDSGTVGAYDINGEPIATTTIIQRYSKTNIIAV